MFFFQDKTLTLKDFRAKSHGRTKVTFRYSVTD